MMQQYLEEVAAAILQCEKNVPAQRQLSKAGYSFSTVPFAEQMAIWDYIWKNANSYWCRSQAFFYAERQLAREKNLRTIWDTTIGWQESTENWSHCDGLAKIYTKALERYPNEVYDVLTEWNKSSNLWKRRQSVVSLLYFSRTKKIWLPFEKITNLVTPLLSDTEYYVQKGLGWTLKELYCIYPEQAFAYARENIQHLRPIAFTIVIEKMPPSEKLILKELRK
jgi:3-methyladenine DNA glycosylase AlkD